MNAPPASCGHRPPAIVMLVTRMWRPRRHSDRSLRKHLVGLETWASRFHLKPLGPGRSGSGRHQGRLDER